MEKTQDNQKYCRQQIRRFAETDGYPSDNQARLMELADTLCDLAKSPEDAAGIVTHRLHDTSLTRSGDARGTIFPRTADLILAAEAYHREQRAKVSWKPERSPKDDTPWTQEERDDHDAKWAAFLADPKNARLASGPPKTGLLRAGGLLDRIMPMVPNPQPVRRITADDIEAARKKKNGE